MIQKNQNNLNLQKSACKNCSVCHDFLTNIQQFFDMHNTTRQSITSNWLTVDDIAKELRISKTIVYRLIRNGELEAINIVENNGKVSQRGHYRIQRSNLNIYLESKKINPPPSKSPSNHKPRNFPKVKNHLGL